MKNKLLFAQCFREMSYQNITYKNPMEYYNYLICTYPKIKKWAKPEIFSQFKAWPDDVSLFINKESPIIAGAFIKANLKTPVYVMEGAATPERIIEELESDNYTHVGFGVYVNSYSTYVECAKAVKEAFPEIVLIAGNVGVLFEGTEKYVDHICIGRGVPFLRKLFNEDMNSRYTAGMVSDQLYLVYKNQQITQNMIAITSKIGCPNNCDFCITNKFFKEFSGELITPQEAYDILKEHRKRIGNKDFITWVAEPTAIVSHDWWYELFDLFRDETGDYQIVLETTSISLKRFNFEKAMNSALRFFAVAMGVDLFDKYYKKNQNVDFKKIISKLEDHGIGTYITDMVGFPDQTEEDVWNEIDKLLDLDPCMYEIHNLKVLPKIPLWNKLKEEGKLLDLPKEFYYIHGFQAFKHDHFKPGFEDMWPLIFKIRSYIERESGNAACNYYRVMKKVLKRKIKNRKVFERNKKLYQALSKAIFPAWKKFFDPSEKQIRNYLSKIDVLESELLEIYS